MNFANVKEWRIPEGEVTKVVDSQNRVIWEKIDPKYLEPFYVENISNANETLNIVKYISHAPTLTIEYKTDNTDWETLGTTSTTGLTKTLAPGEKVYLRCLCDSWNARYVQDGDYQYASNQIQGISKVGGNIMSLLYGNNFNGSQDTFKYGFYNFYQLFLGNTNLIDAENLILTDKLHSHCYDSMFYYCTNLTKAPVLPATSMKQFEWDPYNEYVVSISGSYASMFGKCYSLTQAPDLPATELSSACYYEIFGNCTSLRSAPALPATTLTSSCYQSMFNGCTSLNEVTCLATSNINTGNSTFYWLNNVSSTGTFYKKAGVTWPSGRDGIPSGWTVVEV